MKTEFALVFACCSALLLGSVHAHAAKATIPGIPGVGTVTLDVVSIKEQRFHTTVRQQFDYSCGSAALATLLTYHYHNPVTEKTVFTEMWRSGDQEKIRREGFSLLDIKNYLNAHGYAADGYAAPLAKLAEVGIPAIALIRDKGYNHFVVVKGVSTDKVLVGDPSLGGKTIPRQDFEKMLVNRILFVITSHQEVAVFDNPSDWNVRQKAPLGLARNPGILTDLTLYLPSPSSY